MLHACLHHPHAATCSRVQQASMCGIALCTAASQSAGNAEVIGDGMEAQHLLAVCQLLNEGCLLCVAGSKVCLCSLQCTAQCVSLTAHHGTCVLLEGNSTQHRHCKLQRMQQCGGMPSCRCGTDTRPLHYQRQPACRAISNYPDSSPSSCRPHMPHPALTACALVRDSSVSLARRLASAAATEERDSDSSLHAAGEGTGHGRRQEVS